MLEKWTNSVGNGKAFGALLTDLSKVSLHRICENPGFYGRVFSRIRTESTILPLYGRIRVSETPYSRIFMRGF